MFETTDNLYVRYSYICDEIGFKPSGKSWFSVNLIQTIGLERNIYPQIGRKGGARRMFGVRLIPLTKVNIDSFVNKNETLLPNENETLLTNKTGNVNQTSFRFVNTTDTNATDTNATVSFVNEELITVNKDKLNKVYYEQLSISNKMKEN